MCYYGIKFTFEIFNFFGLVKFTVYTTTRDKAITLINVMIA